MNMVSHRPGGISIVFSMAIVISLAIYVTRNWRWESFAQFKARLSPIARLRRSTPKL
jgi:hypothetical protein